MRQVTCINGNWGFHTEVEADVEQIVNLPHTWNNIDGQDGGGDYLRCTSIYTKTLDNLQVKEDEELWIEFEGVNDSCEVYFNEILLGEHQGGYSTFRFELTPYLKEKNELRVAVRNVPDDKIYPQSADFTFYGGIYRDVNLIKVSKNHFALDYYGGKGVYSDVLVEGNKGRVITKVYRKGEEGEVFFTLQNQAGDVVAVAKEGEEIVVENPHLWNARKDPYLYTLTAEIAKGDGSERVVYDNLSYEIGFRSFRVDPKRGFILNGEEYPLRGVSRHQDKLGKGNALSRADHEEDMDIMMDLGVTTIRLAHYQHNQYVYQLCDEKGMVVWAEIPYISRHMDVADDNATQQMKELIVQTYNNPSIICRCLSNEITMKKAGKDRLAFHKKLNAMIKEMDPYRLTVTAGFAAIGAFNKLNGLCDLFSYNFYFGWYVPGTILNNIRLGFYHTVFPKRCLGLSEYGAEAMTNLHAEHPKRFDNTEEYQAIYHEKMLKIIEKRPYLWATHVWNMFDFGADARNQGGDPGKNHKGLVTFDRKIKKDAYYIYRCYWNKEPMLHVCGSRFVNRTGSKTLVKVYSNQKEVSLYVNGELFKTLQGDKVFKFNVPLKGDMTVTAKANGMEESIQIKKVAQKDPSYSSNAGNSYSWEKKKATKK